MKRLLLPCSILPALLASCYSPGPERVDHEGPAALEQVASNASSDDTADTEELQRDLELAKARLDVATVQLEARELDHKVRMEQAAADIELAKKALKKFTEADMPARVASAELDLRSARDRAQEAQDELEQIEIMYAEQDLNDKTAEFVVSRGRRSAERAKARIAIQEAQYKTLLEAELPMERSKLELAVRKHENGLAQAELEGAISRRNQEISVQEATNKVESLERKLAKAMGDN